MRSEGLQEEEEGGEKASGAFGESRRGVVGRRRGRVEEAGEGSQVGG